MASEFRFLVDEAGLRAPAAAGSLALGAAFEQLVDAISDLRPHGIGKFSMIWEEQLGAHELYEWLFNPAHGIDPVVANAVREALQRTPDWDASWETAGLPTEVSIAGGRETAYSVAAATRATAGGDCTGCLAATAGRRGQLAVEAGDFSASIHFVGSASDGLAFFRDLPEVNNLGEDAYFANARDAFPNLLFVLERTRFGDFDEAYASIRPKVTAHLAVLNDHARAILATNSPSDAKEARFGSLGVTASGESGNTKANRAAMRQREVSVEGRLVVCDWHTKLRPHLDRIYFNATSMDRVVIGVFHCHLD